MPDPQAILAHLAGAGIAIDRLPQVPYLHDDIRIEAPSSISAEIGLFQKFALGAFSHLNGGYIKDASIGRYCSFARDVQIGHGLHPTDWLSVSPLQYSRDYRGWLSYLERRGEGPGLIETADFGWSNHTTVGNDVWLGNHVIIKDGVVVGTGAIVGAGAVVTKSIEPYMIVAGTPARNIRRRFDDRTVERLVGLEWWDYKFNDFDGIEFSDIDRALGQLEERITSGGIKKYHHCGRLAHGNVVRPVPVVAISILIPSRLRRRRFMVFVRGVKNWVCESLRDTGGFLCFLAFCKGFVSANIVKLLFV